VYGFGCNAGLTPEPGSSSSSYRWRLHLNANGSFGGATWVTSPRPMPPPGGEERFTTSIIAGTDLPTLIDMDGDGFLDVVEVPPMSPQSPYPGWGTTTAIRVHRGHGDGTFDAPMSWTRPSLSVQQYGSGWAYQSGTTIPVSKRFHQAATLSDINRDGLPDLIVELQGGTLQAYLNTGTSFDLTAVALGTGGVSENLMMVAAGGYDQSRDVIFAGTRVATVEWIDVDGDGRQDRVQFDANGGNTAPQVRLNLGGSLAAPITLGAHWNRARRKYVATTTNQSDATTRLWRVDADLVDFDADGFADLVSWETGGHVYSDTLAGAPPRLLRSVDNGRGGEVTFDYASTMQAAAADPEAGPFALPAPTWVVTGVTLSPGASQPDVRTTYEYGQPKFGRLVGTDDTSPRQFLGFAWVRVNAPAATGPSGAVPGKEILHKYQYGTGLAGDPLAGDGRGYLVEEAIYEWIGPARRLAAVTTHVWLPQSIFNGAVRAVAPWSTTSRVCLPHHAGETQCRTASDNWLYKATQYQPFVASNGHTVMHYESGLDDRAVDEWDGGYRSVAITPQIRYGQAPYQASDYRVLPLTTVTQHCVASGDVGSTCWKTGQTSVSYDNVSGLPLSVSQWTGPYSIDPIVTTNNTFDVTTGNLLEVRRPNQGPSGKPVKFEYDLHKLRPIVLTNELGQTKRTEVDPGTGGVVLERGPNLKWVVPPDCTSRLCAAQLRWDEDVWTVDGLGRPLTHATTIDSFGNSYQTVLIETFDYHNDSGLVTTSRLIDFGGTRWVKSDTRLDGLGRVLQRTDYRQIAGKPDAVTSYAYDQAGAMTAMTGPDPSDDAKTVTYQWRYDSLGRVVQLIRPDATRTDLFYDGLVTRVVDAVFDNTGGEMRHRNDLRGRLAEVLEIDNPVAGAVASTLYVYDDFDRLSEVHDAEGNTTVLTHDWLGRRTSINRAGRVWRYRYDDNGNMTAEISPVPLGTNLGPYTTTTTYDELDRPKVRTPATVGRSQSEIDALGIGPVIFHYDEGVNGVGALSRVELPRSSSLQPKYLTVKYEYEARGLVGRETRTFAPFVTSTITQSVTRTYNALGLPRVSTWDDGQAWAINYDARALPQTVDWYDPSTNAWLRVADYGERSLAGAPRKRKTGPEFGGQEREWTLDRFGRPILDVVRVVPATGSPLVLSQRAYQYTQTGDLRSVSGFTLPGTDPNGQPSPPDTAHPFDATATFTYDRSHRVLTADGPSGYVARLTYSATGNIETASIRGPGLPTRDVDYQYGAVDAQAVDRMVTATGTEWARFQYDLAGNMTERSLTALGEVSSLTWDGEDMLRRVEGPAGTETYQYDHSGQRIWSLTSDGTVQLFFGESHVLVENGQATRRVEVHSTNESVARSKRAGNLGVGGTLSWATSSIELTFADPVLSVVLSTKQMGLDTHVSGATIYGSFGEVVRQFRVNSEAPQFNAKFTSATSKLNYYGARHYDPIMMRWISADPLMLNAPDIALPTPDEHNAYSFCTNNPLRYYDPDGKRRTPVRAPAGQTRQDLLAPRPWAFPDPRRLIQGPGGTFVRTFISQQDIDNGDWDASQVVLMPDGRQASVYKFKGPDPEKVVKALAFQYGEIARKEAWQPRLRTLTVVISKRDPLGPRYVGINGPKMLVWHPVLKERMIKVQAMADAGLIEPPDWSVGNCSEYGAINQALWDGVQLDDMVMYTVLITKNGIVTKETCPYCQHLAPEINVVSNGDGK
jgi:RHS repeat-associated protein